MKVNKFLMFICFIVFILIVESCIGSNDVERLIQQTMDDIREERVDAQNGLESLVRSLPNSVKDEVIPVLRHAVSEQTGITLIQTKCGTQSSIEAAINELNKVKLKLGFITLAELNYDPNRKLIDFCTPNVNSISAENQSRGFTIDWYGMNWRMSDLVLKVRLENGNIISKQSSIFNSPSNYVVNVRTEDIPELRNANQLQLYHLPTDSVISRIPVHSIRRVAPLNDKMLLGFNGYKKFDSRPSSLEDIKRLHTIRVWSGSLVDAIQLVWETRSGTLIEGIKYGGGGGDRSDLNLSEDEFISSMHIKYGSVIDRLIMTTNRNRNLYWGGTGGDKEARYSIPDTEELLGIYGHHRDDYRGRHLLIGIGAITREKSK